MLYVFTHVRTSRIVLDAIDTALEAMATATPVQTLCNTPSVWTYIWAGSQGKLVASRSYNDAPECDGLRGDPERATAVQRGPEGERDVLRVEVLLCAVHSEPWNDVRVLESTHDVEDGRRETEWDEEDVWAPVLAPNAHDAEQDED